MREIITGIRTADNPPLALQCDAELVEDVKIGGSGQMSQSPVVLDPADDDLHVIQTQTVAVVELFCQGDVEVVDAGNP